jgi:predicted Zn-dependent protease
MSASATIWLMSHSLHPARSLPKKSLLLHAVLFCALCSAHAQTHTAKPISPADRAALQAALQSYDQGKTQEAEPALRTLATRYPNNYEANEALGSLYTETDNLSQALVYLRRACTVAPNEALAHANLGALYLKTTQPAEAVHELELAARLDPRNASTQANLGQALMLAKQPKEAAKAFGTAASLSAGNPDYTYNEALALYEAGSFKESAALLETIPDTSMTPELHSLAGDVEEHAGAFAKALKHFQAAASANPSDQNLYALIVELLRHWNWEEVIQVANFGTSRYPASNHFRTATGIAFYAKGDYTAAVSTFSDLLQHDPENTMAADLLGRSCGALGDGVNAGCAVVGDFARRHPGNAVMTTYAAIAILHAQQGDQNLNQAASLLKEAIAADPNYAEAYLRMGVLEQMRNHWTESTPYLERCVTLSPTTAEAHYRLSRAYAHLGRNADAQKQIALHQQYSKQSKDSLDSRMQEVMRFILSPTGM